MPASMHRRAFVRVVTGPARAGLSRATLGDATATSRDIIRLDHNENPYGPGPRALHALMDAAANGHRYRGPLVDALAARVSVVHNVPEGHVLVSGGSGDIMRACVYAFAGPTRPFVTPRPTYEAPMRSAQHVGAPVVRVPLTAALTVDVSAVADRALGAGLVYICNPNNPTGTVMPSTELRGLIEHVLRRSPDTVVMVDEAYYDYADLPESDSMLELAARRPRLVVTRSFSKIHGMAGMRVGFAVAHPSTLSALRNMHSASSVGAPSLAAAAASLDDVGYRTQMAALNRQVRASMTSAFVEAGYRVARSDANFVFVNVRCDARVFEETCRHAGVLVGRAFPPLGTWARISVGSADDMRVAMPVVLSVLR